MGFPWQSRWFERALREVEFAYDETHFFRRHLNAAGMSGSDVKTVDDFLAIPPTVKANYRAGFPGDVLSRSFAPDDKRLYKVRSSGSTEDRLTTLEAGVLFFLRALSCLEIRPELAAAFTANPRRQVRLAAPTCSDIECASPQAQMSDRILPDGTLVLASHHDLLATPVSMLNANVREIVEYKPTSFYVDAVHLAQLLRHSSKFGAYVPAVPVFSTYTRCLQTSRSVITAWLGSRRDFAHIVSMSELGWVAIECAHDHLHLNTGAYFLELLRHGRPVAAGETGELHVTTLDCGASPHIRYATGDHYRLMPGPCACGHAAPWVEMEGRNQNWIRRVPGEVALTPGALDELVGDPPWLTLYQLEQRRDFQVTLSFLPTDSYHAGDEKDLVNNLEARLGQHVTSRARNHLPAERSGKFSSCRSLVADSVATRW